MGFRFASNNSETVFSQFFGQAGGIANNALLQLDELVAFGQFEGQGQGSNGIQVGAALFAGEDGAVNFAGQRFFMGHYHGPARTAKAFVGGGGDHIGDADRAGVDTGGDKAGDVSNIGHQISATAVGNLAEALPVDNYWIGGETGNDEPGFDLHGLGFKGIIIEGFRFRVDGVGDGVVGFAGTADAAAMCQVATVIEVEAHDGVAMFEQGAVSGDIGGGTAEGLDINIEVIGRNTVGCE